MLAWGINLLKLSGPKAGQNAFSLVAAWGDSGLAFTSTIPKHGDGNGWIWMEEYMAYTGLEGLYRGHSLCCCFWFLLDVMPNPHRLMPHEVDHSPKHFVRHRG